MSLNFRKGILWGVCCLALPFLYGQEQDETLESAIFGEIGICYVVPFAHGNNFLSEGYGLGNGFTIDAFVVMGSNWFVGGQGSHFKGEVTNVAAVGAIDKSGITHLHVMGGYSFINTGANRIFLEMAMGIGYANYRHKKEFKRFRDDGFSLATTLSSSYRITKSIGVYLKLDSYWDFLEVTTAPELENFFGRAQTFAPSIGIKLYTF